METRTHSGAYPMSFLLGFFAYCVFEIAIRGRTHWTMGILGGISFCVIGSMEHSLNAPAAVRALFAAVFVTASEFTVGVFDNLIMGWRVWDYSDRPFNLLGQICPQFSAVWYLLCFAAVLIAKRFCRQYQMPPVRETEAVTERRFAAP